MISYHHVAAATVRRSCSLVLAKVTQLSISEQKLDQGTFGLFCISVQVPWHFCFWCFASTGVSQQKGEEGARGGSPSGQKRWTDSCGESDRGSGASDPQHWCVRGPHRSVCINMIKGILVINNHGKPRLTKFYEHVVGRCHGAPAYCMFRVHALVLCYFSPFAYTARRTTATNDPRVLYADIQAFRSRMQLPRRRWCLVEGYKTGECSALLPLALATFCTVSSCWLAHVLYNILFVAYATVLTDSPTCSLYALTRTNCWFFLAVDGMCGRYIECTLRCTSSLLSTGLSRNWVSWIWYTCSSRVWTTYDPPRLR